MQVSDVAKRVVYNGLDMHAQVFRSPASQKDIVAFYRKAWGPKVVVNSLGAAKVIGHKQGDYYITVQVKAYAGGSKGQIGIIDLATAPTHFEPGKGLPAPMGSKVYNDIRYPDDRVPARTVAMRNDLTPRQNLAYFRERLEGQGWKPAADNKCRETDSCLVRYVRGDSKMALMVMRGKGGRSQVIINIQKPGGG
jgi:hypothetical protein